MRLFLICLGGAVGTGARFLISSWMARTLGTAFPYGTLTVNVLGSYLLSLIVQVALDTNLISETLRLALTSGVMGGFTTYSTFNYETLAYVQQRAWALALANVVVTGSGCLAAGLLGIFTARWFIGR